jgi:hypothetical protein
MSIILNNLYNKNPQQHPLYRYNWITNEKYRVPDLDNTPDPLQHNKTLCDKCFTYKSVSGSCMC